MMIVTLKVTLRGILMVNKNTDCVTDSNTDNYTDSENKSETTSDIKSYP